MLNSTEVVISQHAYNRWVRRVLKRTPTKEENSKRRMEGQVRRSRVLGKKSRRIVEQTICHHRNSPHWLRKMGPNKMFLLDYIGGALFLVVWPRPGRVEVITTFNFNDQRAIWEEMQLAKETP